MKIGFTGTQLGMTQLQRDALYRLLRDETGFVLEFHHGDCIGSDSEAHDIAEQLGFEIVIHPPENPNKRAFKKGTRTRVPNPYLVRNHAIVNQTDKLIATPSNKFEKLRSGTWATIRYAKKAKRPICIIFPNGEHQKCR